TACYVQNRVLVNKSQNKTPYELFNGKNPAIGFLKPFGCHVMILNTLDNLGKFEAKGDEDVVNQEVKKDESSLRYIVIPNWAHDALLESTSSKLYEESSTQVPTGSGNPNPTASSFNPLADQMEILIVESPIPTVSSPVPTACLNVSSEPSSDARLVSKRVANQEETPSLNNILSLTNRFEDILGVSTSSDEIIRVEADV
nr:retrovirus-related Pol polyprotein from transposon TNT 1-94 [Tanacetum cinerariifolium]